MIRRALLALALLAAPARAEPVDVALVLLIDVSSSMSAERLEAQRDGYVDALRSREVIDAIRAGPNGRIALAIVEFSGRFYQREVVPWTVIANEVDAREAAERLATEPIASRTDTAIGAAMLHAIRMFQAAPGQVARRVIDVSGDGTNNDGPHPSEARDLADALRITVNGLPLVNPAEPLLAQYYEDHVIGGPGAFAIPVADMAAFGPALRRKLVLEIAGRPVQLAGGER